MTNEQINIAIAESLGWKRRTTESWEYEWMNPDTMWSEPEPPNYTSDLNACHEFEKKLDDDLDLDYSENLESVTGTRWGANNSYDMSKYRSATARQRCEVYLRTIGKWKETK